jgi:hypothetical protein
MAKIERRQMDNKAVRTGIVDLTNRGLTPIPFFDIMLTIFVSSGFC